MDRYQRVEKTKGESSIKENEIRITTQGRMRNYITYATTLFQEKGSDEIALKAMGRAINKTVMIAELIKTRIVDLHQNTSIASTHITDLWEPLEEGLLPIETTRHVSMIIITLSKKELDTSSAGYQPPLPAHQTKPINQYEDEEAEPKEGSPSMRARGRGGRGRGRARGNYNGPRDYIGDGGRGVSRGGRGRGRGRNSRGRGLGYGGQGGYNDYADDTLPANNRGGRGSGRGRGHGPGRYTRQDGPGRYTRQDGPVQAAAA